MKFKDLKFFYAVVLLVGRGNYPVVLMSAHFLLKSTNEHADQDMLSCSPASEIHDTLNRLVDLLIGGT